MASVLIVVMSCGPFSSKRRASKHKVLKVVIPHRACAGGKKV